MGELVRQKFNRNELVNKYVYELEMLFNMVKLVRMY